MFGDPGVDALTIMFGIIPATVVVLVLVMGVKSQLRRWSDQHHERRMAEARHRAQEAANRSKERQLEQLPAIISAYLGVTGSQTQSQELAALLEGIVRGNAESSDSVLHEKLDEILRRLEALERNEDEDDQGNEEREEEEEEEEEEEGSHSDADSSKLRLRLRIEAEKTARTKALLSHLRETYARPSESAFLAMLYAVNNSALPADQQTRTRIDPNAPTADPAQASDQPVAANAANDDAQRDGASPD